MSSEVLYLVVAFFVIAVIYSSAGFGGGSSYLAVLLWLDFAAERAPLLALLCNVVAVTSAAVLFARADPAAIRSLAWCYGAGLVGALVGGWVELPRSVFLIILGLALVCAGVYMWYFARERTLPAGVSHLPLAWYWQLVVGGGAGLVAGLVGIGGGVFLAPLLYLLRWDAPRRIAGVTSVFILVNSAAGLLVRAYKGPAEIPLALLLGTVVLVGGALGSTLTLRRLRAVTIRRIAALIVLLAGLRMLGPLAVRAVF